MANRLSVIATRTGDDGSTGLGDGSRVGKDTARIAALGDVDELNSVLGLLRAETLPAEMDADLSTIQHDLFDMGAELCIPGHIALADEQVAHLDARLAHYNAGLAPLREFILPGGSRAAALCHLGRTVARRASAAWWRWRAPKWSTRRSASTSTACPTCCSSWRATSTRRRARATCTGPAATPGRPAD